MAYFLRVFLSLQFTIMHAGRKLEFVGRPVRPSVTYILSGKCVLLA